MSTNSKMTLRGVVLIAALTLSGGSAFAEIHESDSANYVMPGCRNYVSEDPRRGDIFKSGLCWGLISGLHYGNSDSYCMPAQVTQVQGVRVVVQYIDARPARMHEDFRKLAVEAMTAAWPCKR
jgi:hypothetical protein